MRLYTKGVDEKLVCELTGHRSNAVLEYKHTPSDLKHHVSQVLYGNQESHVPNKSPLPTTQCSQVQSKLDLSTCSQNLQSQCAMQCIAMNSQESAELIQCELQHPCRQWHGAHKCLSYCECTSKFEPRDSNHYQCQFECNQRATVKCIEIDRNACNFFAFK